MTRQIKNGDSLKYTRNKKREFEKSEDRFTGDDIEQESDIVDPEKNKLLDSDKMKREV